MMHKKKILIYSVPFSGHLNVLKDLIKNYRSDFDFKLVITGWKNIPADIADLGVETVTLGQSTLNDTDPALWTLPRVLELLESCLEVAREFKPDLVLYDFFALEGYFVGKLLKIPYWSSVPALMGPFNTKEYLKTKLMDERNIQAIAQIEAHFGATVNVEEIEMISDGLHMPGEVNIVWSYPEVTPADYTLNRSGAPYVFVGSKEVGAPSAVHGVHARPKIYLSFGTVVMNNLWTQQAETKHKLIKFFTDLAEFWKDCPWDIIFVSQGKHVLDNLPENWSMFGTVDQIKVLSESDVFVTHGGGNSFHEAILQKVPMVVIPFFGDQLLIAKRVEELGIGISLAKDVDIDTHKSKAFLNAALVAELDQAVATILTRPQYRQALDALDLHCAAIGPLLEGKLPFKEGDLLFGTNAARKKYVDDTHSQEEFKILEFKAFSELVSKDNALPRIVDIYHDVILSDDYFNKDMGSSLKPYTGILKRYKEHLAGETDFCKMCIKGLDFFSELYTIHFILDDYNPALNYITTKEIEHVLSNRERFVHSVIFYKKVSGAWIPLDYSEVEKLIQ